MSKVFSEVSHSTKIVLREAEDVLQDGQHRSHDKRQTGDRSADHLPDVPTGASQRSKVQRRRPPSPHAASRAPYSQYVELEVQPRNDVPRDDVSFEAEGQARSLKDPKSRVTKSFTIGDIPNEEIEVIDIGTRNREILLNSRSGSSIQDELPSCCVRVEAELFKDGAREPATNVMTEKQAPRPPHWDDTKTDKHSVGGIRRHPLIVIIKDLRDVELACEEHIVNAEEFRERIPLEQIERVDRLT